MCVRMRAFAFSLFLGAVVAKPTLQVKSDGTFKIALFCDMHFGEKAANDEKSVAFQKNMLKLEAPDLIVIDGDASSNYAAPTLCKDVDIRCKTWYENNWKKFTEPMETAGVPYAYTLGNHDRIPGLLEFTEPPGIESRYAVPDHWIMAKDATNPHSLTQDGPSNIHGASNYVVPVHGVNGKPVAYIWLLDSSDNNCDGVKGWGCVYEDQVAWFSNTSKQLAANDGKMLPGVVFHHIPMDEVLTAWNDPSIEVNGSKAEEVCCGSKNTGLFQAVKDHGNIWGVFHGHDHNNDFVALYQGIHIGFGRKSGYGGYGGAVADQAGSRIIEFVAHGNGSISWSTWIREDSGQKVIQTKANRSSSQTQCCGMAEFEMPTGYKDVDVAAQVCRAFDDHAACRKAAGLEVSDEAAVVV